MSYVYDNTFGMNRAVWEFRGTRSQNLMYYLNGQGAVLTLGHNTLLLFGVSAAAVVFYASRKRSDELARLAASGSVLAVLYLVNVINPTKTAYTGVTFQIPFVFVVMLAICDWAAASQSMTVLSLSGATWTVFGTSLLAALSFQGPERFKRAERTAVVERKRLTDDVIDAIVHAVEGSHSPQTVFLTGSGDLNAWLLDYRLRQRGIFTATVTNDQFDKSATAIVRSAALADWVAVGSSNCAVVHQEAAHLAVAIRGPTSIARRL